MGAGSAFGVRSVFQLITWYTAGVVPTFLNSCISLEDPDPQAATDARVTEYTAKFANPYVAASRGYVDDIIDPRDTRPRLIDALETLRTKRDRNPPKKHGNIPL